MAIHGKKVEELEDLGVSFPVEYRVSEATRQCFVLAAFALTILATIFFALSFLTDGWITQRYIFLGVTIVSGYGAVMCGMTLRDGLVISKSGLQFTGLKSFSVEWSEVQTWYPSADGFVACIKLKNGRIISLANFRSLHGDGKLLKIFQTIVGPAGKQ